jgi:alcohol dehydrogenase class IV
MMLAATLAGIGFGSAGVHIPHACAYPIASLKHEWTPPGYPGGHAFVPHGFSVAVTAPAAFAFTAEALPERHAEAARLLGADGNLSEELTALMNDVGAPTSLRTLGYRDGDLPTLVDGALQQERLLVCAPRTPTADDLRRILARSL